MFSLDVKYHTRDLICDASRCASRQTSMVVLLNV